MHALRRDLLYAHEGMIRGRQLEDQTEQAWCLLTLATNAVLAWTTEFTGLSVDQVRRAGRRIDDDVLAHISPAHSENIQLMTPERAGQPRRAGAGAGATMLLVVRARPRGRHPESQRELRALA
nr:Tn3 family transposase [Nocardia sp. CY41]